VRLAVASAALVAIAVLAAEMLSSGESIRGGIGDRPPSLLAIADDGADRRLLRLDSSSLRPLPRSVRLDEPAEGWAWDPDGSRAAVVTAGAAALLLLDLQRMRTLATVRVGSSTASGGCCLSSVGAGAALAETPASMGERHSCDATRSLCSPSPT
jgi:hypothetical protein